MVAKYRYINQVVSCHSALANLSLPQMDSDIVGGDIVAFYVPVGVFGWF